MCTICKDLHQDCFCRCIGLDMYPGMKPDGEIALNFAATLHTIIKMLHLRHERNLASDHRQVC